MPFPPLLPVGVSWHTLSLIPLSVRAVQGPWHRLELCMLLWWLYTGACHSSCCLGALGGVTPQGPLVFGLSWVLTLSNDCQQLPFNLRAVSVVREHILPFRQARVKLILLRG